MSYRPTFAVPEGEKKRCAVCGQPADDKQFVERPLQESDIETAKRFMRETIVRSYAASQTPVLVHRNPCD